MSDRPHLTLVSTPSRTDAAAGVRNVRECARDAIAAAFAEGEAEVLNDWHAALPPDLRARLSLDDVRRLGELFKRLLPWAGGGAA